MNLFFLLFLFSGIQAFAADKAQELAQRMAETGTILEERSLFRIKSPKGSIMEVQFSKDGNLIRAEGKDIKSDELFIGVYGLPLSKAVAIALKNGAKPRDWDLEKMNERWIYTFFEVDENSKETFLKVDALTGKIIN